MSTTLYYSRSTASLVVHWLLIELGIPHELHELAGDGEAKAGSAVGFVKEAGPESKIEFGDHAAGSDGLAGGLELLTAFFDPLFLPRSQRGNGVEPLGGAEACDEAAMHGIPQRNLGHLQGRIQALGDGDIAKIPGKCGGWGGAVLPVGVEAFCRQTGLHLLEKLGIHSCRVGGDG